MPVVNPLARELVFKIVYYGPGLGGKTSSLQHIHATSRPEHRGKMVSLATPVDRTLYFDFLPLRLPTVRGMGVRLQLFTVPGQVYYNATRKLVLTGADGVVMVLDSQRERLDAGLESLQNLRDNLREHGRALGEVPWILQYNKRDLPDAVPFDELEARANPERVPAFGTVATDGTGIYEALEAITSAVLQDFARRIPQARGVAPPELFLPEGGLTAVLRAADVSQLDPVSLPVVATPASIALTPPGEVEASAAAASLQPHEGPPPPDDAPPLPADAGAPEAGPPEPAPLHILELLDVAPSEEAAPPGGRAFAPSPGPETPRPGRRSSRPPLPALAPAPLPEAEPLPSLSDPAFSLSFALPEPEPVSGDRGAEPPSVEAPGVAAAEAMPASPRPADAAPVAAEPMTAAAVEAEPMAAPAAPAAAEPAAAAPAAAEPTDDTRAEAEPMAAAPAAPAAAEPAAAAPAAAEPTDDTPATPRNVAPPALERAARSVAPAPPRPEVVDREDAPPSAASGAAEPPASVSEGSTRESAVEPPPDARAGTDRPGPRTRRSLRPGELGALAAEAPVGTLSFEALWPEGERPTLRAAEAALGAGDAAQALPLLDQLLSRTLAGAAGGLGGAADAPRDPGMVVLLLGLDGRRWLRFRALVRDARAGRSPTPADALQAFAFVLEVRVARARLEA